MKRLFIFIFIFVFAAVFMSLSGCSGSSSDNKNDKAESSLYTSQEDLSDSSTSDITATSSSLTSPLELEVWGSAAKYSTQTQGYVNVPVRITKIISGTAADKAVKVFTEKSEIYTYSAPDKNSEWVIAEYEFSLDGFPVPKGGVSAQISSYVLSEDGEFILSENKTLGTVMNISPDEYFYEGTVTGQIAYQMLKNPQKYIIVLGEADETQAFFTIES